MALFKLCAGALSPIQQFVEELIGGFRSLFAEIGTFAVIGL